MIKQIKYALAFIFGAIYTSAIWYLAGLPKYGNDNPFATIFILFLMFSTAVIITGIIITLSKHWNDKE
jgi:ABC-type multidrug transport system permease subunit